MGQGKKEKDEMCFCCSVCLLFTKLSNYLVSSYCVLFSLLNPKCLFDLKPINRAFRNYELTQQKSSSALLSLCPPPLQTQTEAQTKNEILEK